MGTIFALIAAIFIGIFRLIVAIFMIIIKFAVIIIQFLIKIIIVLWQFIVAFFKVIISGLGKLFSFFGKLIASGWKMILSLFSKSSAVVSSVGKAPIIAKSVIGKSAGTISSMVKAPIVAKSIATVASGTALTVSTGTLQTAKTITPIATQTVKGVVKTTKQIIPTATKTIRRITNIEKNLLKNAKLNNKSGKLVAQRNSTFNPQAKDALGRNNIERMEQGRAPIGKDGKSIELHHLKQQNNGTIVELTSKEHNLNSKVLHRYTKTSEINRQDFDKWKRQYWKERAKEFK